MCRAMEEMRAEAAAAERKALLERMRSVGIDEELIKKVASSSADQ